MRREVRSETLGEFEDDYGIRYAITATEWRQGSDVVYHVVDWDFDARVAIARNDGQNPSEPGRWTRIDWIPLEGMAPYTWAYCLTVYDAASRGAAADAPPADGANPRTGCGGHPFSRMRPGKR